MVRMLGLVAALAVSVVLQVTQAATPVVLADGRLTDCEGTGLPECVRVRPVPGAPVHMVAVGSQADPFHGRVWRLFELQVTPDVAPMHPSVPITLEIDTATGQASGKGGCNRYFGGIALAGTQLSVSGIGATQMACPPPAMDEEAAYLAALERVTGYAVDGDVLSLTLVGGGRLRYRELLD